MIGLIKWFWIRARGRRRSFSRIGSGFDIVVILVSLFFLWPQKTEINCDEFFRYTESQEVREHEEGISLCVVCYG